MIAQNKRLFGILAVVAILLLVPFIAMQFSSEVNWSFFDFVVAGVLLLGSGLGIELVLRKVKTWSAVSRFALQSLPCYSLFGLNWP